MNRYMIQGGVISGRETKMKESVNLRIAPVILRDDTCAGQGDTREVL